MINNNLLKVTWKLKKKLREKFYQSTTNGFISN